MHLAKAVQRWVPRAMALALVFVSAARAQTQSSALGVKVGEGRLHPFLDVDSRFDSAAGLFGTLKPELVFTFRGGTKFELSNDSTNIGFTGAAEYLWFSGLLTPESRALSRFQARVGLETAFNRDGVVEVQVGDSFLRSDRTQNPVVSIGVLSLFNEAHLALPIHPGGRALEVTPRIRWAVEFFDPLSGGTGATGNDCGITCDPAALSQMNYSNLNFGLGARYKFLPKTAFILDSTFDYRTYWAAASTNRPANVLRVMAGLNGLISPRIAVTLMAGVAHDFVLANVTAPIGQAELSYIPTDLVTVSVGYLRTVMPTPVFGVFADDRGYVSAKIGMLDGRLRLNGDVSVDAFSFYGTATSGSTVGRNDVLVGGRVGPTFSVTSWFDVGATYGLSFRTSTVSEQTVNFTRHEVMLRLTLHY